MRGSVTTALLSVLGTSVLATPVREGSSILSARNTNLYRDDDGYAIVEYGDGRLDYGDRLPSSVLDIIRDECGETACNPAGGYSFTALEINERDANQGRDRSYTVNVEGTFNLNGDRGSKEQLLSLAKLGFEEVFNAGVAELREDVLWRKNICPPSRPLCAEQDGGYADQWTSTDHVHVRINNDDGTLAGFLNVGVSKDSFGSNGGICAALQAATAGIGLVNSAAGAGLTLLSIGCSEL